MGVEIMLLDTVRSGYFTTVIHIGLIEHLPLSVVIEDVARLVHKVTTFVSGVTILILNVAFIILEYDNVTLIIAIEVSENITLVEISLVHERRDIDWLGLVSEVLKGFFTHLNFSFDDLIRLDELLDFSYLLNNFSGLNGLGSRSIEQCLLLVKSL
jgi:hypothetical protein